MWTNPFNNSLRQKNRDKFSCRNEDNIIFRYAVEDIMFRACYFSMNPEYILEIGGRDGVLTSHLISQYPKYNIIVSESSEALLERNDCSNKLNCFDDEVFFAISNNEYSRKFDLIISMLNIHWINDITTWFKFAKKHLNNGGIILCSFFGNKTLYSLRKYLVELEQKYAKDIFQMHIMPFIKLEDATKILEITGFKNIVVDINTVDVSYKNVLECILDIKNIGENAAFNRVTNYTINKAMLNEIKNSREEFATQFDIITVCAKS